MGKAKTVSHSFSSLEREHTELEYLFGLHQRALLAKNIDTALAILNTFQNQLDEHVDYEERTLLPIYAEEGGEIEGGTLKIFQAEHEKLRKDVSHLSSKTDELYAASDMTGAILALLDEETLFKGLFHHHALREK